MYSVLPVATPTYMQGKGKLMSVPKVAVTLNIRGLWRYACLRTLILCHSR